jgi:hypothetical protein
MAGLVPTGSGCGRDTHTLLWVLVCFAIAYAAAVRISLVV